MEYSNRLIVRCRVVSPVKYFYREVKAMPIHESGEDYLEAIYVLAQECDTVRSIDVAHFLNFSKPSVSRAVGILVREGMLVMEKDRSLKLTAKGLERASSIYNRHVTITEFLEKLGVPKDIALHDACLIEHDLSEESFAAIKRFQDDCKNK